MREVSVSGVSRVLAWQGAVADRHHPTLPRHDTRNQSRTPAHRLLRAARQGRRGHRRRRKHAAPLQHQHQLQLHCDVDDVHAPQAHGQQPPSRCLRLQTLASMGAALGNSLLLPVTPCVCEQSFVYTCAHHEQSFFHTRAQRGLDDSAISHRWRRGGDTRKAPADTHTPSAVVRCCGPRAQEVAGLRKRANGERD